MESLSKYVSCLHRRSCLVYAHQEEWALITCSLVPRPHPVFQCCTLKNVFQRATLKNWVTCTKSCIVCEVWDGPRPPQCICACALGVSHPAHTTIRWEYGTPNATKIRRGCNRNESISVTATPYFCRIWRFILPRPPMQLTGELENSEHPFIDLL